MIALSDYWRGFDATYGTYLTPEIEHNAEILLGLVNLLLSKFGEHRKVRSGWRPAPYNATVNGAARNSLHITGQAIDLEDPDGTLDDWLMAPEGRQELVQIGLWMEHPSCTMGTQDAGWTHLQSKPPRSGNRAFYR